jgi:hypothetical protein
MNMEGLVPIIAIVLFVGTVAGALTRARSRRDTPVSKLGLGSSAGTLARSRPGTSRAD